MRRAVIDPTGRLDLGEQAQRAGYRPGQLVEVLVTSAGSLIVSLAADDAAIDVPCRPVLTVTRTAITSRVDP